MFALYYRPQDAAARAIPVRDSQGRVMLWDHRENADRELQRSYAARTRVVEVELVKHRDGSIVVRALNPEEVEIRAPRLRRVK